MSAAEPIRYFDRYRREVREERIYGERWMRLAYGSPAGRLAVWLVIRRAFVSRFYGWKMRRPESALKVIPFISKYNVDVDEFVKSSFDFKSFNDFFCRELRPSARPIAPGYRVAVLPADGRHLAFSDVDAADGFYVKGAKFTVAELLRGEEAGVAGVGDPGGRPRRGRLQGGPGPRTPFDGCSMLISRLCPVDYHRFHFPVGGVPAESRTIGGFLYSVSPVALRVNIRYLVENKRQVTSIESPVFGTVAMVEIGATNVGNIKQAFVPGRPVRKGDEKGFFAFGGSCVVTLFQRGKIVFDRDLVDQSAQGIETFAKMGDRLGEAPS